MVKRLLAMWETRIRSLGWEDPLEKEMATHSSILAWKIAWTKELVGYSPWGAKSRTRLSDFTHTHTLCPKFLECVLGLINYQYSAPGINTINLCSICLREKQLLIINLKPIQLVHCKMARGHGKGW